MKVLILGGDGYLGWPTAMSMAAKGFEVTVLDSSIKRQWQAEFGVRPLWPVSPLLERVAIWNKLGPTQTNKIIRHFHCDIATNYMGLCAILEATTPEAIIHYAEQPSAPFSMATQDTCVRTQANNILGTLNLIHAVRLITPDAHIIKLGTMGEYGTPNIDIEEGWLDVEHKGRKDRVLYPKRPNSWYHLSKVHDSHNLEFACRNYRLAVTDLNQGIVYGVDTLETILDPGLRTAFHYDDIFGTVINRFIVQAMLNKALTVYGEGTQTRGFINILDTIQCVTLAAENPAEKGEFRVMNQMTESFTIRDLANAVGKVLNAPTQMIPNPRKEQSEHYYNVSHTKLKDLGLIPNLLTTKVIESIAEACLDYKDDVNENSLNPRVIW